MDDQRTCSSENDSSTAPTFQIAGNSFAELQAAYRAVEAVELRRLYHEEQNRLFDKMSKKQQRLAIAQDVLAQLAAGKIKAKHGVFVDRFFSTQDDRQLSEMLEEKSSCSACALGGMFVCAVKRLDHLTAKDLRHGWDSSETAVHTSDIKEYLGRCFDDKQLELIEIAFENGGGAFDAHADNEVEQRAKRYCRGVRDSGARMRRIMRNIVRNGGKFVP